jgi:hypothetical protein
MTRRRWILLTLIAAALALLAAATVWAAAGAQESEPAAPLEALGTAFTYQGKLEEDGVPKDSTCDMAFELYDAAALGRQIGSTILMRGVVVEEGLFTVELDFASTPFGGYRRWLDVQVQCAGDREFTELGRQELTAVPYALYALDAAWGGLPYAGVVVVAKSGGDYGSVQAAIDSITTASAETPYLVWVAPGVYEEQVTMAPYVHLQGAGQDATTIRSDAATALYLAGHTSLRDLTVLNAGTSPTAYAIQARASDIVSGTLVTDVTARAQGTGYWVQGIRLVGSDTNVRLLDVTAHAEGGSDYNFGLGLEAGAAAVLQGGSFTVSGGQEAYAIDSPSTGNTLEATGIFALAENAASISCGLENNGTATLHGGTFAAHGGDQACGIYNGGIDASLEAESVTAEGLDATTVSRGLDNALGASATLHGGSFTARGAGSDAHGIANRGTGATLQATGISAVAKDASTNYGLYEFSSSVPSSQVTLSILEGSDNSVYGDNATITHSRLVGGGVNGWSTCVAVSYGSDFYPDSCP